MNSITFILQRNALRRIHIHLEEAQKDTDLKVERSRMPTKNIDRRLDREFFLLFRFWNRTFTVLSEQLKPHLKCSTYRIGIQPDVKLAPNLTNQKVKFKIRIIILIKIIIVYLGLRSKNGGRLHHARNTIKTLD